MLLATALALGLGVGAADSNKIIVRLDGQATPVTLAGVAAGSPRAAMFAKCLVAGRVLRIKGPRNAATAVMLDDSSVAAHINEFLQTNTSSDPCTIGRAAYQTPPLPATPAAKGAAATSAAPAKKPAREIHVSFGSGEQSKDSTKVRPAPASSNEWGTYRPAPRPQPAASSDQPTYANPPTAQTYPELPRAGTYNPPTAGTAAGLPQGSPQPALPQQGTQPLPQQGPVPVPTTTYAPQPPL